MLKPCMFIGITGYIKTTVVRSHTGPIKDNAFRLEAEELLKPFLLQSALHAGAPSPKIQRPGSKWIYEICDYRQVVSQMLSSIRH